MWPLFQPIRALEILKLCEISWDLLKKYFHLKSNAVYNSSAKKLKRSKIGTERHESTYYRSQAWGILTRNDKHKR